MGKLNVRENARSLVALARESSHAGGYYACIIEARRESIRRSMMTTTILMNLAKRGARASLDSALLVDGEDDDNGARDEEIPVILSLTCYTNQSDN